MDKEMIEFSMYLTGNSESTIRQLYTDWKVKIYNGILPDYTDQKENFNNPLESPHKHPIDLSPDMRRSIKG